MLILVRQNHASRGGLLCTLLAAVGGGQHFHFHFRQVGPRGLWRRAGVRQHRPPVPLLAHLRRAADVAVSTFGAPEVATASFSWAAMLFLSGVTFLSTSSRRGLHLR